jgi:hypothetical protein
MQGPLQHGCWLGISFFTIEVSILCMAAKWEPDVLFCMPNRTNCILLVSVMPCATLRVETYHAERGRAAGHRALTYSWTRALVCLSVWAANDCLANVCM